MFLVHDTFTGYCQTTTINVMGIALYVLFLLLQLFTASFIIFLCVAFVTGGPFVPSSPLAVDAMIKEAHIKPGMTVYDVGSGDGRVLFAAAKKGATAVGIEINPYLVWYTQIHTFFSPYRARIRVHWGNLWTSDLRKADLVFVYLIPWKMNELAKKLTNELPKGAIVVSNSFIFPEWKLLRKDSRHHIYTFQV